MKKFYLAISVAAVLFAGCAKTESPEVGLDDGVMRFSVDYPATKATETAFEPGDKIGVYITGYEGEKPLVLQLGGNYKNNNPVIFDGETWVSDPVIYWGKEFEKYDVYAYYPFGNPQSVDEMAFDISTNQNAIDEKTGMSGYESSDFLFASKKGVTSEEGAVNLLFRHKMSKFSVVLKKGDDFEGEIPSKGVEVYIHNTVVNSLVDLSSGDVLKHPMAAAESILARQESVERYSAIVVPQMILYKMPLVEIVCNGVSYMIESRFQFKSGTHHTMTVTLNNNPEKVKIEIGGEIEGGWN